MPWNGKRKVKPLEVSKCCCAECDGLCPDPPAQSLVRCEPCHYGDRHGFATKLPLSMYCAGAGHDLCDTQAQHRAKLAAEYVGINEMLRTLDHVLDVAGESKWGQLTLSDR